LNFLAHFLAAQPIGEEDFLIGSLLPDITRRAGVTLSSLKIRNEKGQLFAPLLHGIEFHWFADKKFHQSNLFQLGVALWKVHLEKRFPGVERKFFLFHLLFEMWLDRLLLSQDPGRGTDMYDSLALTDTEVLGLFSRNTLGDRNGVILKTYQSFLTRKFVLDYASEQQFARLATEVFSYVTQQPWKESWMEPVLAGMDDLKKFESDVLYIWELFLQELREEWARK
jgi:hypothetical protein